MGRNMSSVSDARDQPGEVDVPGRPRYPVGSGQALINGPALASTCVLVSGLSKPPSGVTD